MKVTWNLAIVAIALIVNASQVRGEIVTRDRAKTSQFNLAQTSLEEQESILFIPRPEAKDGEPDGSVNPPPPFGESLCPETDIPLTAIVPHTDGKTRLTLTAQERPTFWFYVPYETPLTAKFLLKKDGEQVDIQEFKLSGKAGLIGVTLPPEIQLSALEENYDWVFILVCNPYKRAADLYVSGSIRRVNPTPNLIPLPTATPQEKAKLYASDGLWNDTLTSILQELSLVDPVTSRLYLTRLLEPFGFGNLVEKPVVGGIGE
ncbi:MAG: DUF928 domain-containing protein [Cyanobacteriota bacterium]|nr:DUF928 domain-containing protein [Cyanobacteriota bacterium]